MEGSIQQVSLSTLVVIFRIFKGVIQLPTQFCFLRTFKWESFLKQVSKPVNSVPASSNNNENTIPFKTWLGKSKKQRVEAKGISAPYGFQRPQPCPMLILKRLGERLGNPTVCTLVHLPFAQHFFFYENHPCRYKWLQFINFHCCIKFHFINIITIHSPISPVNRHLDCVL